MSQIIASGRITQIEYALAGSQVARQISSVQIHNDHLFSNNKPEPGGLFDPHLDTTERAHACTTGGLESMRCLGHPGQI